MDIVDRLAALLPEQAVCAARERAGQLTQVRLRADHPVQLVGDGFRSFAGPALSGEALRSLLATLMEHSVYARQEELDQGFFTLDDGSRVGVCGRMYPCDGHSRMGEIGSACIRVARQVPGCAEALVGLVMGEGELRSVLLVSPPGLGKTTLLRDLARCLSVRGYCVGVVDERHELAACSRGVPTLDVGPCADVMDGCPRSEAIGRMLRAMSPELLVVDEVGGETDAAAIGDAARCGVAVAASAHAGSFAELRARRSLRPLLDSGALRAVALLGPKSGQIKEVWRFDDGKGDGAWRRE